VLAATRFFRLLEQNRLRVKTMHGGKDRFRLIPDRLDDLVTAGVLRRPALDRQCAPAPP